MTKYKMSVQVARYLQGKAVTSVWIKYLVTTNSQEVTAHWDLVNEYRKFTLIFIAVIL